MRRMQAFAVLSGALLVAGCEHATRLPRDISTHGSAIDHLFWLIMAITGITFIGTEALLIWSIFKFRHREGRTAQHTHGNHLVEMVWTIVPGIILFFLAIYQIPAWNAAKIEEPEDEDCVHVRVLGKQFEWAFQYAGPDGRFDTDDDPYTLGEFVIPAGKMIKLKLRSLDVLHSFFLPNLRFKQDLVPGKEIVQWVQTKPLETTAFARALRAKDHPDTWRTYDYEIACAELCGDNHQKMRGVMTILEPDEFEEWQRKRSAEMASIELPKAFQEVEVNGAYIPGWELALTTDDPQYRYRQPGPGEPGFQESGGHGEKKGN